MDAIALFESLKQDCIRTGDEERKSLYSALFEIPDASYTTFIKLGYFRECERRKSPVQRFQDILPEYKTSGNILQLFISHKWEASDHPDRSRRTLKKLLRLTKHLDDDVAIWLDYCSLPQKHSSGEDDRTAELKDFFTFQLSLIPVVILNSQSIFLLSDEGVQSGWCCAELLIAQALLHHLNKMIYTRKDQFDTPPLFMTEVDNKMLIETDLIRFDHKICPKIYCTEIAMKRHKELTEWMNVQLNGGNPTPYSQLISQVSPELISQMMSEFNLTFTEEQDRKVVADMSDPFNSFKWTGKQDFFSMWHYVKGCLGGCLVPNIAYRF